MHLRKITDKDFDLILEQDKKVYPTDSPVTKDILKHWFSKNSEFGMIYEDENGNVIGDCIIIPLTKDGWKKLISGKLSESSIPEEMIFDNSKSEEIGIHIYHIEKVDKDIKEFYKIVLQDLKKIIEGLRKTNLNLKVVGFSGLCVTSGGIGLFNKKFNCKERDYICDEYIFKDSDGIKVVEEKDLDKHSKENLVNRCPMFVTYPGEDSLVWEYL